MNKNTLKSEAEAMLNEVLGGNKRTLKKEYNEILTAFNLKRLSREQIDQALENDGYYDNRVKSARFEKVINRSNEILFKYRCEFDDESGPVGAVIISVSENGYIVGEFTGLS